MSQMERKKTIGRTPRNWNSQMWLRVHTHTHTQEQLNLLLGMFAHTVSFFVNFFPFFFLEFYISSNFYANRKIPRTLAISFREFFNAVNTSIRRFQLGTFKFWTLNDNFFNEMTTVTGYYCNISSVTSREIWDFNLLMNVNKTV